MVPQAKRGGGRQTTTLVSLDQRRLADLFAQGADDLDEGRGGELGVRFVVLAFLTMMGPTLDERTGVLD